MAPRPSFPDEQETAVTLARVPAAARVSRIRLDAVPWVIVSFAELRALELNHREGFILSHIDGRTNVEALLDLAGMHRDEALEVIERLVGDGVIQLR